jgi:hypothetical protein
VIDDILNNQRLRGNWGGRTYAEGVWAYQLGPEPVMGSPAWPSNPLDPTEIVFTTDVVPGDRGDMQGGRTVLFPVEHGQYMDIRVLLRPGECWEHQPGGDSDPTP